MGNLEKILVLLREDEYESYTHVFFPLLMDFLSPRLAPNVNKCMSNRITNLVYLLFWFYVQLCEYLHKSLIEF